MPRALAFALVCCGICLPLWAQPQEAVTHLVIQALDRPLVVRLVCLSGRTSWRQHFDEVQSRYLKSLFTQLDADGNEKLTPDEARRLPGPRLFGSHAAGSDVHIAFNFRVLDVNGDGAATPEELEGYVTAFGETPVRLASVPVEQSADHLFRALDADRDRIVTESEASQIEPLSQRDRDANRVLSIEELRGRTSAQSPPEFVAAVAANTSIKGPLRVQLQAASSAKPDLEIRVEFTEDDSGKAALPEVAVTLGPEAESLGISLGKNPRGEHVLKIGSRLLVLRVLPPAARQAADDRAALEQEFTALVERTSGNVTLNTEMSPALKAIVQLADRNGDDRLEPGELQGCLDRVVAAQSAAAAARLRVIAFAEQPGLLPFVDLNRDSRLSRRELLTIPEVVKSFAGEDGKLSADEAPSMTLLVLQRGPFPDAAPNDLLRSAGPVWFTRADRNADGDLDREEFLGTPEDFERFDLNRDGWIELEEALRADPAAPQPESRP